MYITPCFCNEIRGFYPFQWNREGKHGLVYILLPAFATESKDFILLKGHNMEIVVIWVNKFQTEKNTIEIQQVRTTEVCVKRICEKNG